MFWFKQLKLTLIIVLLSGIRMQAYGQMQYQLYAPDTNLLTKGVLFKILPRDTLKVIDSMRFFTIVFADSLAIAKQKLIVYRKGRSILTSEDSLHIIESNYYHRLINGKSDAKKIRIDLYLSDSLPIVQGSEPNYQIIYSPPLRQVIDSVKSEKKVNSFIKVNGRLTIQAQVSDNTYEAQGLPRNYLRAFVNTDISIGGLPLKLDYVYTTESNSGMHRINNYRITFDYQTFYNNIKKGVDKNISLDRNKKLAGLTEIDITKVNKDFSDITRKLQSKNYKKSLTKHKDILMLAEKDSSFKKTYRYKKSLQFINEHEVQLKQLAELEKAKQAYLKYSRMADTYAGIKELDITKPSGFKKAAQKYGYNRPALGFLLSLRKFDLGTFDPDYSQLVLSGVSLTGVNIELNVSRFYTAFTWGASQINFENPFSVNLSGSRVIAHGRVGFGRKEKSLFAISILRGKDANANIISDSNGSFYISSTNYVIGADYTYQINENSRFSLEYARTILDESDNLNRKVNELQQFENLLNIDKSKYTSAWNARIETTLMETRTKLSATFRQVDPYYYSFGTPFLRKDNLRLELKGEQPLWKNQLNVGLTYRYDSDNIHLLKEGTSVNHTYIFKTTFRRKKWPFISLIYSPSYQRFYSNQFKTVINTETKLYSLTSGYTFNKQMTQTNLTANYTKQFNSSNQEEIRVYHIDVFNVTTSILIKSVHLTVVNSMSYIHPWRGSDSTKAVSGDLEIIKGLFKNNINAKVGYGYFKDFALQERHILKVGISFSILKGLQTEIDFERHFISYKHAVGRNTDMHLGRLTIIKTF